MSRGQTGFVPGTKWVCPRDKPRFSPFFTQWKPSLSLGQTQFVPGTFRGRRAAERVYVLKVYVPFSFPKIVNYYAVLFLLRPPNLVRRGPFLVRKNVCNSQETGVRTRRAAIVNHPAVLKIPRVVNLLRRSIFTTAGSFGHTKTPEKPSAKILWCWPAMRKFKSACFLRSSDAKCLRFGLPLRFGLRCECPRCKIVSHVGRAMRATKKGPEYGIPWRAWVFA